MDVAELSVDPGAGLDSRFGWDWDREIRVAIAMVAQHRDLRLVLCDRSCTGRVIANLARTAADAGVVLEPRIRRGGGWDVEVRAG